MRHYVLGSMTCYPLCLVSPWTDVYSLTRWKLWAFQDYLYYFELQILLLCIQLTCLSSQRDYVKFHLRNYYDHSFHEHTSLGSPKRTHCLNPMRYHSAFIENTYCYRLPSIVTQSIGNIWLTYDLTRMSKSLLNFAQAQYSLKVERQHNEVAWWGHDYLITLCHGSP